MGDRRHRAVAWAALFGLALALRCRGLSRSLWYDELVSLQAFSGSLAGVFAHQVQANNHPLASLLLWLSPARSELGLRLPFAVLGALSCPALAWSLACWGRARSGVLAGVTLAVLPPAVLLGQQARGYAGLLLCVALLPGLAIRGPLALRAAVPALGVGFHASFLLAPLAWVGLRPRAWRAWGVGIAAGGLLCGGVYPRTWRYLRRALREGDPGAAHALGADDLWGWLSAGSPVWGAALLACVALGLTRLRGRERWLAAPLLGVALLLALGVPGYPRFAAFALPCLCALAGRGLASLPAPRLGCALLVALAALPLRAQAQLELQDLRGAAAWITARGATPYASGFACESVRHYAPEVRDDLPGFLEDPGPAAFVDPFPRLTPPELREALERRAGAPTVLPGRHPVAIYFRARSPSDARAGR
ncbi:MAG: hypothetical protein KDD82_02840 [Planctomycetes bacterium]|nr:hypothetical protein [Planctomycetota bacterium]